MKIEKSFSGLRPLHALVRLSDFVFLSLMFRLIINVSKVERVHFTSRSFFLPLLHILPDHVLSSEYMHAVVHPYHPAYSASWLKPELQLFPKLVIDTNSASWPSDMPLVNSRVISWVENSNIGIYQTVSTADYLMTKTDLTVCVIGQPFNLRPHLRKLVTWCGNFDNIQFIYCPHPRELEEALNDNLEILNNPEVQNWAIVKGRRDIDILFGIESNALVEASKLGYRIVISDGYMTPVMKSLIPTCLVI